MAEVVWCVWIELPSGRRRLWLGRNGLLRDRLERAFAGYVKLRQVCVSDGVPECVRDWLRPAVRGLGGMGITDDVRMLGEAALAAAREGVGVAVVMKDGRELEVSWL